MVSNAGSGRPIEDLDLARVLSGEIQDSDTRIAGQTLQEQADAAAAHGNRQLAENFRRAAELTRFPDDQVLALYEALRPRRSTAEQLRKLEDDLTAAGATNCAALVREARSAYQTRGLLG